MRFLKMKLGVTTMTRMTRMTGGSGRQGGQEDQPRLYAFRKYMVFRV